MILVEIKSGKRLEGNRTKTKMWMMMAEIKSEKRLEGNRTKTKMWMMMVEIKSGKRLEGNRTGVVLYPDLFVSSPTLFDKCFDYNDLQTILAK